MAPFDAFTLRFQQFPRTVLCIWVSEPYGDVVPVAAIGGLLQERQLLSGHGEFELSTKLDHIFRVLRLDVTFDGHVEPYLARFTIADILEKGRELCGNNSIRQHAPLVLDRIVPPETPNWRFWGEECSSEKEEPFVDPWQHFFGSS